jgi:polysaccharide export outer membrane protein
MTVLDAIAMAGGFRDFAKTTKIFILRANPDGSHARIPFNYKEAIRGVAFNQNPELQPHDTVVVP